MKRSRIHLAGEALVLLSLAVCPAPAGEPVLQVDLEVPGASADCRLTVLETLVPLDREPPHAWREGPVPATIEDRAGNSSPAEAELSDDHTLRLRWVASFLPADATMSLRAQIGGVPDKPATFRIADVSGGYQCLDDGKPVYQGMTAFDPEDLERTKKVYHHLWSPGGDVLLTKGPGGHYSHHRGLFVGWKTTTVGERTWDSWHMADGNTQRFAGLADLCAGPAAARAVARVDWRDPDGAVYARDTRDLTAYALVDNCRLLDVVLRIESAGQTIAFGGDLQHAGLQFRAANEVAAETEKLTRFVFPAPEDAGGATQVEYPDDSVMGRDFPWGCMTFVVENKRYGVLYMSHPSTRRPAEFSIRYYGRFGEYFPYTLAPGQPLDMRYRLAVFEGERPPAFLAAAYRGYADPPRATVIRSQWQTEEDAVPRTYLIDGAALAETKQHVRAGDPALRPVMERLLGEAEKALNNGPFSVTDKEIVPPSGDKHDYMSLGSYWWPNPDTADGLPYVRRDGEANPENRKLDHGPLRQMCAGVDTLALAYYLTGDARYAEHAAQLLRVWFLDDETKMNPHLRFGQGIPGVCEGRGIGIIDTARPFSQLVDSVALLRASEAWTAADRAGLEAWFAAYLAWLLESELGLDEARQPNNHGTWYDVQAAALALHLGQEATAEGILREVPTRRIATQIEPDGRQPLELQRTLAFGYSTMNLAGMFDLATLGEHVGLDLWRDETPDGRGIRKALDWLLLYLDGKKAFPYQQIHPWSPSSFQPLLRRAAQAYDEPHYESLLETVPGVYDPADRMHLLYPQAR